MASLEEVGAAQENVMLPFSPRSPDPTSSPSTCASTGQGGTWTPCGDVAATLVSDQGHRFSGVCIDTGSGTGFCAEASAIAAMVTSGRYRIASIVAVWRSEEGRLHVLPPCGRCRELVRQVHPDNLSTQVVLSEGRTVELRELLPAHGWPAPESWLDRPPTEDRSPGRR